MNRELDTGFGGSIEGDEHKTQDDDERAPCCANAFGPEIMVRPFTVDRKGDSDHTGFRMADEGYGGHGGQGAIRKVFAPDGQTYALKVFQDEAAAKTEWRALQDFRNFSLLPEPLLYGAVTQANDPGLVGKPCIVMEYIEGETLSRYLSVHGAMSVEEALGMIKRIVEFCAFAWDGARSRLVHHDIKPDNILVEEQDGAVRPRLIDFGTSFAPDETAPVFATQGYAPPEVFFSPDKPKEGAFRSDDSFSIAATLLTMLAGETVTLGNEARICRFPAYGICQNDDGSLCYYTDSWSDDAENALLDTACNKFASYSRNPRRNGLTLSVEALNSFRHDIDSGAAMEFRKNVRRSLEDTYGKRTTDAELNKCIELAYGAMDRKIKHCLAMCLSAKPEERPTAAGLKAMLPIDERPYFHELRIIAVANALAGDGPSAGSALSSANTDSIELTDASVIAALDDYNSGHYAKCLPVFDKLMHEGGCHSAMYNIAVMVRDGYVDDADRYDDRDIVQMMAEAAEHGNLLAQNWYGRVLYGEFAPGEHDLRLRTLHDDKGNEIRRPMAIDQNKELGIKYLAQSARDNEEEGRQGFVLAKRFLDQRVD